jgi:hypothetical protein
MKSRENARRENSDGGLSMPTTHDLRQSIETGIDRYTEAMLPPLYREWQQLGQELVSLEDALAQPLPGQRRPLTEQERREKRARVRQAIIAQLYRDEESYPRATRYLAFLVVKKGRGGVIVGNPSAVGKDGSMRKLPYTGLEGYYAGSEQTAQRPGLTAEKIIQEEADIGETALTPLKEHAIEHNDWAEFSHLKHMLAGGTPDEASLQTMETCWSTILSHLHVRVYRNPEFELTLSEKLEQMEQFLSDLPRRTAEEKHLHQIVEAECARLRQGYRRLSQAKHEQELHERRRRESIRADRLEEFQQFREATYELVTASGKGQYAVKIQDASFKDAAITETIVLPDIPERETYPPTDVHLTPEQLEGYLFLASLGEIGGDPLARPMLVSR